MATIISLPNKQDHDKTTITVRAAGTESVLFDVHRPGKGTVCSNITFDAAEELRDALTEALTHQPIPVHPDWDDIKVGELFGFYKSKEAAERGGRYPYVKVSETHYESADNPHFPQRKPAPVRGAYGNTDKLFVKPAPKTARQLFDELPIDGLFSYDGNDGVTVYRKSGSHTFYSVKGYSPGMQFERRHVTDTANKHYNFDVKEV